MIETKDSKIKILFISSTIKNIERNSYKNLDIMEKKKKKNSVKKERTKTTKSKNSNIA